MNWLRQHIDIVLILAVGFVLRFTISFTHSYSNDELSAVSRLRYDNFSDLLKLGVENGDMHPAGVQVFMKGWSLIFGKSEIAMRFPFVIFGTLAIFVLFLIGKEWFNRKVGLLAAGMLAVLYFPIMNSEFARPYSPGLLISLLVGLYFYKVLFEDAKKARNAILLGLLFAVGMYTHYFAFLFVGFIGLTGLFFLTKKNWKYYCFAGGLGILLFLPHIGITLHHLGEGGLQWLAPPSGTWLFEFIFHAFNSSVIVAIGLILMLVLVFLFGQKVGLEKKQSLIFPILWFFGIFIVGFILSYLSTPVLKFPVMLFAFPYFLLLLGLLFARIPKTNIVLVVIMSLCLGSTLYERDLYGNHHYALFKEPGIKMAGWNESYGKENIYKIYNTNAIHYFDFYAEEWGGYSLEFDRSLLEYDSHNEVYLELAEREEEYCVIGFSSRNTVVQMFETVREFYPVVVDYERYNNGSVFLMKKGESRSALGEVIDLARFDSQLLLGEWDYDASHKSDFSKTDSHYRLDSNVVYGPRLTFQSKDLPELDNAYLMVEVTAELDLGSKLLVTFTGERNGEIIQHRGENMWIGQDLQDMIISSSEKKGFFAFKIPSYILPDDALKISLWNAGNTEVEIKSYTISYVENYWN